MLEPAAVEALAQALDDALLARRELAPLSQTFGAFSTDDAYRVQRAGIARRLSRGEQIVGYKLGLTSAAKRAQMNLTSSIHGVLTSAMRAEATLEAALGVHPKIEPEIAFVLGHPLSGTLSREQAWSTVAGVGAALEVLDSRFTGFKYFSLPDVIADDASSWRFVLASTLVEAGAVSVEALGRLAMRMSIDGVVVQQASSAAISGHPVDSLVELAAQLALRGEAAPAGAIVLAGAATVAEPFTRGRTIRLDVDGLPSVEVRAI